MKYKVVVNGVDIVEKVSASKALNAICNIMQGACGTDTLIVKVMYLNSKGEWATENGFRVVINQLPRGI